MALARLPEVRVPWGNDEAQDEAARKSASVTIRIIGSSGEASKPNRR
jgi:hypothetical protein